jgi:hypothetical protein
MGEIAGQTDQGIEIMAELLLRECDLEDLCSASSMDTPTHKRAPMLRNRRRDPNLLLIEIRTEAITQFDSSKSKPLPLRWRSRRVGVAASHSPLLPHNADMGFLEEQPYFKNCGQKGAAALAEERNKCIKGNWLCL